MRALLFLLLIIGNMAHARIDHDGKDHKIEETRLKNLIEAAGFFNGNLIGVSESKRAEALSKLRRFAANYPELDAFRKKIEKMKVTDPMRIEIKVVENTVRFSVFHVGGRKDTHESFGVDTTPAMAEYYRRNFEERAANGGCAGLACTVIQISPTGSR